ncbi:MAG TPA: hypothetical protein VF162_11525 [Streptosporangiaceae bacterium]
MSDVASRGHETALQGHAPAEAPTARETGASRGRRRLGWLAAGLVALLATGMVSAWWAGVFSLAATPAAGGRGAPPPATAMVTRRVIAATMPVSATLGYSGSWTVIGHGGGTLTRLPPAGRVVRQGQALYRVDNGSPVVLLYGIVPAWRNLREGVTGSDVSQLNHDLVALKDASRSQIAAAGWDCFSWETTYGVQKLEEHLGVSFPPGSLPLGQVVFEPAALRVAAVTGRLGGPASGPVLTATSDRHVVRIALDASEQSEVKAGDKVSVTLPDGTTTPGVVSSVGTVAVTSESGGNATTTIPVEVKLTHPQAAGSLDQAPVTVYITTATARGALAVPVTALLAQPSGDYAVEVVGAGNTRRYVPVRAGIFDDTSGLVQVFGALAPGQRVVVAAS